MRGQPGGDICVAGIREELETAMKERDVNKEKEEQLKSKLANILSEMLETERIYVKDLEEVPCFFYFQLGQELK